MDHKHLVAEVPKIHAIDVYVNLRVLLNDLWQMKLVI